jgi:hypothetical protein
MCCRNTNKYFVLDLGARTGLGVEPEALPSADAGLHRTGRRLHKLELLSVDGVLCQKLARCGRAHTIVRGVQAEASVASGSVQELAFHVQLKGEREKTQ